MPSPTPGSPPTGWWKPGRTPRRCADGRRNSAVPPWSRPSSSSGSGLRNVRNGQSDPMRTASRLAFAAAPPVLAALLGANAARDAPQIYAQLEKPRWAPPAGVFGPVWTALYALIGAAGWRETKRPATVGMTVHLAQLGLNASWTPLFFAAGRRRA